MSTENSHTDLLEIPIEWGKRRDGSMWIAQKDTSTVPGSPESDWKLCTKRGRDGKDGKAGLKGEKGDPGRPGRDLTQIGADGSKW